MARVNVPIAVIDPDGNAVAGATVRVIYRDDSVSSTLYQAEVGPTTTPNPTTTDGLGRVNAWVDRGSYYAEISGSGIIPYTQAFDAAPASDAGIDALWLPTSLVPPVVTALPSSPSDGDQVYCRVGDLLTAEDVPLWLLRYSADYEWWDYISGRPMITGLTLESAVSSTSTVQFSDRLRLVLPLDGDYFVELRGNRYNGPGGAAPVGTVLGMAITHTPTTGFTSYYYQSEAAKAVAADTEMTYPFSITARYDDLEAGHVLEAMHNASANVSVWWSDVTMKVTPLRVRG